MTLLESEERDIFRFLRKVVLNIALWVASPFLMLAFLFLLFRKPALWILVPLAVAALVLTGALILFLVVRARLRDARRTVEVLADNDFLHPPP